MSEPSYMSSVKSAVINSKHGKAKRARRFPQPQSTSRSAGEIEPQIKAATTVPLKPGDVSELVRPRAEIEDNKQRTTASGCFLALLGRAIKVDRALRARW